MPVVFEKDYRYRNSVFFNILFDSVSDVEPLSGFSISLPPFPKINIKNNTDLLDLLETIILISDFI